MFHSMIAGWFSYYFFSKSGSRGVARYFYNPPQMVFFALLMEDYKMEANIGRATEKKTLAEMLVSKEAELIAYTAAGELEKHFLAGI